MNLARIDRVSRSFLTLNRDREYATLKRMLALSATDAVLDVGSGDGFWTARLAKHCASVIGLEPDEQALGYTRTLHNRPNVRFVHGAAGPLAVWNESERQRPRRRPVTANVMRPMRESAREHPQN
jgi:16S rRNA A1518/A1519 N6-dimethyltransferase RsmA/KsgA/DIM1 with predicted DNA glycosylase/AP lyase activity